MSPERCALLAQLVLALPLGAFSLLALATLVGLAPSERVVNRVTALALAGGLLLAALLTVGVLGGPGSARVELGTWFAVPGYALRFTLLLDRLSLPLALATLGVCGLVGRFSARYLHRERRHRRFFLLLLLFTSGMLLVVLAGDLDLLFGGWELLGLASALLIAFFDERAAPVRHALRCFLNYRACDVGILLAAALLHHGAHGASFQPMGLTPTAHVGPWVGVLLVVGALGKSAQLPVSGWLPRAMEGPTPSSALCYGALSVHAGVYLLLRAAPFLEASPAARALLGLIAGATAVWATLCARVQSDVKNGLAFASLAQVSLMLVEVALGLYDLALWHMLGHIALRTLQFLRAPNALLDAQLREAVAGEPGLATRAPAGSLRARLWVLALDRFHVDLMLERFVVGPVMALARGLDRWERRCARTLGDASPEDR
ncbi:MAG: proton-conducting transporter membrane subunit [Planctomycetota bacterium]